jgi:hypothetical protein
MKILPVGAELSCVYTSRQADMTKQVVTYRNLSNARKNKTNDAASKENLILTSLMLSVLRFATKPKNTTTLQPNFQHIRPIQEKIRDNPNTPILFP